MPGAVISSAAVNDDFSDIASALTDSVAADGQTTMTGPLKAAAGSAANPSFTFGADTDTGFYQTVPGVIQISINGTGGQFGFTSAGLVNTHNKPLTMPIGALMDFAGTTAPDGWLLCYGQSLDTTTYALLFAVIGYTYGGSGVNFSLPDYRGRTSAAPDNMGGTPANRLTSTSMTPNANTLGASGGSETQTIGANNLPTHTHPVSITSGTESTTHNHTIGTSTTLVAAGANVAAVTALTAGVAGTSTESATHTHLVSGNTGNNTTTATGLETVQPTLLANKIIFAGA